MYTPNIFQIKVEIDLEIYGSTANHASQRLNDLFKDRIVQYKPFNAASVIAVIKEWNILEIKRYEIPESSKGSKINPEKEGEGNSFSFGD